MNYEIGLVWFRRDLRLSDHTALAEALKSCRKVYCAFIFDSAILDDLRDEGRVADRRVEFILRSIEELAAKLESHGGSLIVREGAAAQVLPALARELKADAVFANGDYEPYARQRDDAVARSLAADDRKLLSFKDTVVFEKSELLTGAGSAFSVFTPYKNAWLKRLTTADIAAHENGRYLARLAPGPRNALPSLAKLGFQPSNLAELKIPTGESGAQQLLQSFAERIGQYDVARDFPGVRGPSYLSVHLRFGTISIRELVRFSREHAAAGNGTATWLSELTWRDFYHMILWHHPHVADSAFKPAYDRIAFENGKAADANFSAWCEGRTGYPLVDAAMAQINQSGYMHNRLRMVVASFLIKDLGIDWRRGERYFARELNDFDLAANNGGWQWAASSGCDAQPYFRIFNPLAQSEKFDADGSFIRRYLPQLAAFSNKEIHAPWKVPVERQRAAGCVIGTDYPAPIVDHGEARDQTLRRYAVVKQR